MFDFLNKIKDKAQIHAVEKIFNNCFKYCDSIEQSKYFFDKGYSRLDAGTPDFLSFHDERKFLSIYSMVCAVDRVCEIDFSGRFNRAFLVSHLKKERCQSDHSDEELRLHYKIYDLEKLKKQALLLQGCEIDLENMIWVYANIFTILLDMENNQNLTSVGVIIFSESYQHMSDLIKRFFK